MRIKLASDIHGAYDELAAAARPEDTLFLLGDYINIIDYTDMSGLLAEFVDRETIERTLGLIHAEKIEEARALMAMTAAGIDNLFRKIAGRAEECYAELFSKLPCPAYVIYGNVDFPAGLVRQLSGQVRYVPVQEKFEIGGRRVGFVSGTPKMNYSFGMPGEVTNEEYARRLRDLGPVDRLFVHPPPALYDLTWDTKAVRNEGGSEALLDYIREHQPESVYFGHVHSPIVREMRIGRTLARNLGCFRDEKRLTEIEW